MIILGIDPGLATVGYGLIEKIGNKSQSKNHLFDIFSNIFCLNSIEIIKILCYTQLLNNIELS